jgi:hypothetical protein
MSRILLIFISVLFGVLPALKSHASHLRAGEITAVRTSCTSLTFIITIKVYLDTESGVTLGGNEAWLDFGDGGPNSRIPVPIRETIPRPDLGKNMGTASFSMTYTYTGFDTYTISFSQVYRNKFIVNMDNSDATNFYVETEIMLDPFLDCNRNLPTLIVPPIDQACTGVAFFHNPGAVDLDGDSLSYELITPEQATGLSVWNYKEPVDQKFYTNFQLGNENKDGVPLFSINPLDGTIKWDAPGAAGEYNIAFHVLEWRKNRAGVWQRMSITRRDMQIIVEDCDNQRPDLIIPNDTCVTAGTVLQKTIFGTDPESDEVKIEVFSEVLDLAVSPATFSPDPPGFQPSSPPAKFVFEWNTQCEHVKEQFYQLVFKITDNPANGPKLVTFKTWRIKVVAPAPSWSNTTVDMTKRSATLQWDDYICENAIQMEVWRKIDGMPYSPDNCETGMPGFLGYDLIGKIKLIDSVTNENVSHFIDTNNDKGLAPGAKYCYRLVAVFPDPKGGESYVSTDTCLAPIPADAPVITNVSVEKTHIAEGAIRISWYGPFDIDRTLFPGPYEYEVYRGSGFNGTDLIKVSPQQRIVDTTFVDDHINTEDDVFNYRIVLFSNTSSDPATWIPIDTSAVASSVRLSASTFPDKISLSWNADVPWLNATTQYPYHLIFRGTEDMLQSDFELIDSVFVLEGGFRYLDEGQYKSMPLDKNQTYCYRILTRGIYGNSAIHEPLENFSQVICIKPDDDGKPCPPVLSITMVDCDELFSTAQCAVKDYSNRISWTTDCAYQVNSYRIYASSGVDNEFVLLAGNVKDTFYIDKNLPSFARCYRVAAVDAEGTESEQSEIVCNDNCPYFELPNIFSPNGDGCNEYFSAYGPFNPLNQNAPESCALGDSNYSKCARFVQQVTVSIFNRWGKEVYTYSSGIGENSIYINWDGKDNDGTMLSSGVYFYLARVNFDTLEDNERDKTFKGWVHLVR